MLLPRKSEKISLDQINKTSHLSFNFISELFEVQFLGSGFAGGVLINIECKAWAHNIHHDRAEQRGSVHFELMVD